MLMSLDKIVNDYDLKIHGVLHIGAHYGEEYNDYVRNGIRKMIFFEPIHSNYLQLCKSIPNNDEIRIINQALGNMKGITIMNIESANNGQSCSIFEPLKHLEQYPNIVFDKKEVVSIDKLDNIEFDRNQFNMINIDVQGYELEVFKGAIETLPFIDIIYTEVNREELYKNCAMIDEIDTFLSDFGFVRILTDWTGGTWGDALYLKK